MSDDEVQTTVFLELEGKIQLAVTHKSVAEIEGLMQAEHLIPLTLNDEEIFVQAGSIEYLRVGDQRSEKSDPNASVPPEA
jgi:hypothetical protein